MGLNYPGDWKFEGTGISLPGGATLDFHELALQVAAGAESSLDTLRVFKRAFGDSSPSTNEGWAETDLLQAMRGFADNAVAFVDAFWTAIERIGSSGTTVPTATTINRLLDKHHIPLRVDPPSLKLLESDSIVSESEIDSESAELSGNMAYELGDELGSGGFGIVYRAIRKTRAGDFEFAIKILEPSAFIQDAVKAQKRFTREIRALQNLQHRAIITYVDAGFTKEGKPFIVMPLIDGVDLRTACEGKEVNYVKNLFMEVIGGIQYAHSHDVLHRDLKPSNILVRSSDGQAVILDFGCAYLLDNADSDSVTTSLIGSLGYIPPEVLSDPKRRDPLHDVYSCGVILYELIARERPDPYDYKPLATFRTGMEKFDALVLRAVAPASERMRTIVEFREGLSAC